MSPAVNDAYSGTGTIRAGIPAPGGLEVDNTNFLTWQGQPIALFGVSNFWALADPDVQITALLDAFAAHGSNFHRCSMIAHTVGKRVGLAQTDVIYPFQRSATPGANDGGNKFDCTAIDATFTARVGTLASEAASRGIILGLILWDEIPLEAGLARWEYNPFADANNVNGLGLTGTDGLGSGATGFYNLSNSALLAAQEALLTAVLDELAPTENALLWVGNEYTGPDAWHQHWHDAVAAYNTANGTGFLTGGMEWGGFTPTWCDTVSNPTDHAAGVDDWRATRPVVNHKTPSAAKWVDTPAAARAHWWNVFCYGAAGEGDDSQDGADPPMQWTDAGAPATALDQVKVFHDVISLVPFNSMAPEEANGTLNGGNSLWRYATDAVYLGFFAGGGSDSVDLSATTGTYTVTWYDATSGASSSEANRTGMGAAESFTSPYASTDSVLVLEKI